MKQLSRNEKLAVVGAAVGVALLIMLLLVQVGPGMQQTQLSSSAETQYGEKLNLQISVVGQTLSGSWGAAEKQAASKIMAMRIGANASQNLYTVNSTYYSQQKVQYSITVAVTGTQVQNVVIANLTLKCIDTADQSQYNWLAVLAQGITLPYSHEWTGWQYISDHLTNCAASTTDATIQYKVYVKVTATGTVSGLTLTAETNGGQFYQFVAYHFVYTTEGTSTTVTPSVGPASWTDVLSVGLLAGIAVELCIVGFFIRQLSRRSRA